MHVNARDQTHLARPLIIAVINNMPDAALRATERQFCQLLAGAAYGMHVDLRFYSLPEIIRAAPERAHIARYYDSLEHLLENPPDGLIVTGAEPKTVCLTQEAFWPSLGRVVDWVEDNAIPGIWSCLAAHAAIKYGDGITRQRLPTKLSGVFPCAITRKPHQILHGMPSVWRVPHSRLHGLGRRDLESNGYTILSQSPQTGVDMFMRRSTALQLFLQSHPEYDSATLLLEYRRDVLRAKPENAKTPPALPHGLWTGPESDLKFSEINRLFRQDGDQRLVSHVNAILKDARPDNPWSAPARKFYSNWLTHLHAQREHQMEMPPLAENYSASVPRAANA
jgi:homoserine O-succinyltransferase